jgi:hypothetical protein
MSFVCAVAGSARAALAIRLGQAVPFHQRYQVRRRPSVNGPGLGSASWARVHAPCSPALMLRPAWPLRCDATSSLAATLPSQFTSNVQGSARAGRTKTIHAKMRVCDVGHLRAIQKLPSTRHNADTSPCRRQESSARSRSAPSWLRLSSLPPAGESPCGTLCPPSDADTPLPVDYAAPCRKRCPGRGNSLGYYAADPAEAGHDQPTRTGRHRATDPAATRSSRESAPMVQPKPQPSHVR